MALAALHRVSFLAGSRPKLTIHLARSLSDAAWPAEVPAGAKPFDPNGPLAQIDTLLDGLPSKDPWVVITKSLKELRVARDKLQVEWDAQGPSKPAGLVTTASGNIDEDYYVKSQGIHPSFVTEMRKLIEEERSQAPTPKPDTSWKDAWDVIKPMVEEEQKHVLAQLEKVQAKERDLTEIEERLDDMTVDEMLEKYPHLAQEIKDEIEAGDWERRPAGYKIGSAETSPVH